MENRHFLIIKVEEVSKVDFSSVVETSEDTLRKSVDKTKTFVKWEGNTPSFVESIEYREGPYTYREMRDILQTSEWQYITTVIPPLVGENQENIEV